MDCVYPCVNGKGGEQARRARQLGQRLQGGDTWHGSQHDTTMGYGRKIVPGIGSEPSTLGHNNTEFADTTAPCIET